MHPFFNIYQVELSSYCNMRCSYCPHPSMERPKGYMTAEVLDRCIELHIEKGRRRMVLHHFGEPLLHPAFEDRLQRIASAGLAIQLSSNALLLEKMWPVILKIPARIRIMISVHQWVAKGEEKYMHDIGTWKDRARGTNVEIMDAYNFKEGHFVFHAWGDGQKKEWDTSKCPFIEQNFGVILWNGDIASCCVDHEGYTVRGNIMDEGPIRYRTEPWKACATCDVGRIMIGEDFEKM